MSWNTSKEWMWTVPTLRVTCLQRPRPLPCRRRLQCHHFLGPYQHSIMTKKANLEQGIGRRTWISIFLEVSQKRINRLVLKLGLGLRSHMRSVAQPRQPGTNAPSWNGDALPRHTRPLWDALELVLARLRQLSQSWAQRRMTFTYLEGSPYFLSK